MPRHTLLLITLLALPLPVCAQKGSYPDEVRIASIGGEVITKEPIGGRIFASFGFDYLQASPFSWSFTRDPRDGRIKLSVNPLLTVAALPAFEPEESSYYYVFPRRNGLAWLALLLLPQALTNLSLQAPVIPTQLYLSVGQRTDFYLLNDVAKIYTEAYAGVRFFGGEDIPLSVEARYVWPLSQGFLENKRPYIGVGLSLTRMSVSYNSPLSE